MTKFTNGFLKHSVSIQLKLEVRDAQQHKTIINGCKVSYMVMLTSFSTSNTSQLYGHLELTMNSSIASQNAGLRNLDTME